MIAIHYDSGNNFSIRWKEYCIENNLPYKLVSCYDNDILEQLQDCKALMWHITNFNYKDQIFAKYLIKTLEQRNIKVFPDYNTVWHYDDKVAQKYLLEAVNAPLVKTYVFYDKKSAFEWIEKTTFPKVFKLRKGSGSKNVMLAKSRHQAKTLAKKAFGKGFPTLEMSSILKERYRKFRIGQESFLGLIKGFVRLFIGLPFSNMSPNEIGYIYFQEFLPNNSYDQRIIVIGDKAVGLKRMVRANDFRASGSGSFFYERELFDIKCVEIAFDVSKKLKFQSMAYDFIYNEEKELEIVEISYCFNKEVYYDCPGYWDENLTWHESEVVLQDWMLEDLLKTLN